MTLQWSDERVWGSEKGNDEQAVYIHKLSVADDFRGTELSEQVLDFCADMALRQGKSFMRLDCSQANEGLCNYYIGLGFEEAGRELLESGYDPLLLQKAIEPQQTQLRS